MALPKLDIPIYETEIPSTGEKIKYRPYLTKEEKILLMAKKGGDKVEIINATKQVINNCILKEKLDVDSLTLYDLEFLLMKVRSKSQGEELVLIFSGDKQSGCEECRKEKTITVNVNDAKIVRNEKHTNKIILDEKLGLGLIMKEPDVSMMNLYMKAKESDSVNDILKIIWKSVDVVFDSDNQYSAKESSEAEYLEFLESLTQMQMRNIEQFFDSLPKLQLNVKITCKTCKKVHEDAIEGLYSFFP